MSVDIIVEPAGSPRRPREACIPRVPEKFREMRKHEGCYDPQVVSIGPYHHGKPELDKMEKLKSTIVYQFAQGSSVGVEEMHHRVGNLVIEARGFYTEDPTNRPSDEEFTKMMVRDGCFIIHFLSSQPEDLEMTREDAAMVTRDLFLLENQLPMMILISLSQFTEGEKKWKEWLEDFFEHIRGIPPQRAYSSWERIKLGCVGLPTFSRRSIRLQVEELHDFQYGNLLKLFYLSFLRNDREKVDPFHETRSRWYQRETSWNRYYPVKELKKVGIRLKPSRTSFFTDVRFTPTLCAAEIHVPPLCIDDFTKPLILNLVAYEASLGSASPHLFTSYVCFMRSLIDSPEDVKELRSQGILLTTIDSHDDQVVQLFKDMATNLVDNPDAFIKVKKAIKSHFSSPFWRWILNYKGPISTAVVKYSFLYGFVVSAIQAYVSATQQKPGFGNCSCPNSIKLHP